MIAILKNPGFRLLLLLLISGSLLIGCQGSKKEEAADSPLVIKEEIKTKQLRHVVLFKFKEDADTLLLANAQAVFLELPNKISEIVSFEWGLNSSPEGLNKGLTHCYLLSFSSEADRDSYLVHPDHQSFVSMVGELVEDVTVVDYWVE